MINVRLSIKIDRGFSDLLDAKLIVIHAKLVLSNETEDRWRQMAPVDTQ